MACEQLPELDVILHGLVTSSLRLAFLASPDIDLRQIIRFKGIFLGSTVHACLANITKIQGAKGSS